MAFKKVFREPFTSSTKGSLTAECVKSCMSGALRKDPESGHVFYDEDRCGSCFMCVMNCPFGVLKPDSVTNSKVIKCDFCVNAGGEPSCVAACPTKAIYVEEV